MTQGEMKLTEAETVAEVTHLGRKYQLRRADNGGWQVWRSDRDVWTCAWWVPEQNLDSAVSLVELFKLFGAGSPVPPEVMRAFASAGARQ